MAVPELPRAALDMLLDTHEHIRNICGYRAIWEYASGSRRSSEFCIVTDSNLYVYKKRRDNVTVKVADIDKVTDVRKTHKKDKRVLKGLRSVMVCFIVAALITLLIEPLFGAVDWSGVFAIVFGWIYVIASWAVAIVGFFVIIRRYKYSSINVMHIYYADDTCTDVLLPTTSANEESRVTMAAIKAAQRARRADNPDVFYA